MRKPYYVILLSVIFGSFVWIADAFFDYMWFYKGEGSFLELLIFDAPVHEIYIHSVIMVCFLVFGLFMAASLRGRLKTEETLRSNESKYRTLFESAGAALVTMELSEKGAFFRECNSKAVDLYGCTREELINHSPVDFSPEKQPDGEPSAEKAMKLARKSLAGETPTFEWTHRRKDGSIFEVEVSLQSYEIEGEQYTLAVMYDITERKQREEELRKLKDELETKVTERTKELQERVSELQRYHDATTDRELRMKELQKKIDELVKKLESKDQKKQ